MHERLGKINYKLVFYVVLCSSMLTLAASLTQIYFDYRSDMSRVNQDLDHVQSSYLEPIATSLFKLDEQLLDLQLYGILELQAMAYLEVFEFDANLNRQVKVREIGDKPQNLIEKREFKLSYRLQNSRSYNVGELHIYLDMRSIYARLLTKFFVILGTNAIKMFIASFLILLLFQHLLTKHLQKIASFANQFDLHGGGGAQLSLDRPPSHAPDELDDVVHAINSMSDKIARNLEEIHHYQENLEAMVADKTKELTLTHRNLKSKNEVLEQANADLRRVRDQLIATQSQLEERAHSAGMAEIAADTLHNIGNFFNSLSTHCTVIQEELFASQVERHLARIINNDDEIRIREFSKNQFLGYIQTIHGQLQLDKESKITSLKSMSELIYKIKVHLEEQRKYASGDAFRQDVDLEECIDQVCSQLAGQFESYGIEIEKDLGGVGLIHLNKTRLIHILHILVNNSLEALLPIGSNQRKITFRTRAEGGMVVFEVEDTGIGIDEGYVNKVFQQGFTTKKDSPGLGLHNCANYVIESGGTVDAKSAGHGTGATVTIHFVARVEEAVVNFY